VLEQVVTDDIVASRASGKLFVLFLFWVGLVVDDEIDDGCSPVELDDKNFLALHQYQVGLRGRILLELHRGAAERLDEHSCWDKNSFRAKFGEDVCCRCLTSKPTKGYPRGDRLSVGCRQDQKFEGARNTKL
jgi:hypothetical protein